MNQLQSLLNQATGNLQNGQQTNSNAGLNLDTFLTGKAGLATGAAAGGLVGLLLGGKKGRKMAGNVAKVGGVALVGGLAYKAWRDWQNQKSQVTSAPLQVPASPDAFIPVEQVQKDELSRTIIRSMIAAARADGQITDVERDRIIQQADAFGLDAHDQGFIARELSHSVTIEDLVQEARCPEIAAEIYTASLLAVDPDGDAEQAYLKLLQTRLQLEDDLVRHIHAAAQPQQFAA